MQERNEVGSLGSSLRVRPAGCDEEEPRTRRAPQLTLTLDRKVESANRALCQLTGYTQDDIVGGSVLAFVHPEDMEALVLRLEALARDIDLGLARPIRIFCTDGHPIRIEASLDVTRDPSGRPSSIGVTVMNVTTQCSCITARSTHRCEVGQRVPA
jgi:PAS domain S-box-containing protein